MTEKTTTSVEESIRENFRKEILDPSLYSLPSTEEYYINAVDTEWYTRIVDEYKRRRQTGNKTDEDLTKDLMYYQETPPILDPGYYPTESVFVIRPTNLKAYNTESQVFAGGIDGDTIRFSALDAECGDEATQSMVNNTAQAWYSAILGFKVSGAPSTNIADVRILCVDCPEVAHVSVLSNVNSKDEISFLDSRDRALGDIANDSSYTYLKYQCVDNSSDNRSEWVFEARSPETVAKFIDINGGWHEVLTKDEYAKIRGDENIISSSNISNCIYVTVDDTQLDKIAQGNECARMMYTLIQDAQDARIIVESNTQSRQGDNLYPSWADKERLRSQDTFLKMWDLFAQNFGDHNLYQQSGFNMVGQELYGRMLGVLYLQVPYGKNGELIWINAAKYLVANSNKTQINKSINSSVVNGAYQNFVANILRPETYEYNERLWADAVWDTLSKADNRFNIQTKAFNAHTDGLTMKNKTFDQAMTDLKDWTVLLGDVAFMVPPTSIRCISQTRTERVPVVRSKGTIAKGMHHSDRLVELHLYFNGKDGINGVPVEDTLPNDSNEHESKITYYINGARALLAEFKLTPFLPIENNYINNVLGIHAVCFSNISLSTVPGFPFLLQCVLTLREFDIQSYMPQLPPSDYTTGFKNYFAQTINYDTMRYYYQRPLLLGEELAKKNLSITSDDFMAATLFSNRTAMIPMTGIKHSMADFYIANEDYLKELLQIQRNMANKAAGGNFYTPNEIEVQYMQDLAKVAKGLVAINNDTTLAKLLSQKELQNSVSRIKTILTDTAGDIISSIELKYEIAYGQSDQPYLLVNLYTPYIENETVIENLKAEGGKYMNISGEDLLKDNAFKLAFKQDGNGNYYVDTQSQDCGFIAYCAENAAVQNPNEHATQLKQAIDLEQLESIHFETYIKNVRISSFSATCSNWFTNIALQNADAVAPQYMGGQDIDIQIELQTSDAAVAALLGDLPRISSYLHRVYHSVLPMYPVRIDSEFTNMLGVTEIAIETVTVNTVPNMPHLYSISLQMKSVDRTLRNREALQKVDIDVAKSNEHITEANDQVADQTKTYFDLNRTLSQVNLYPDLELPTIQELSEHGFQFVRYKNRTMKYPDPDFYIIYPGVLMSEAIRAAIVKFIHDEIDTLGNTPWTDKFGAKFEMNSLGYIDFSTSNNEFRKQMEMYRKTMLDAKMRMSEIEAQTNEIKALSALGDLGAWDISSSIKAVFLETYYYKQLIQYASKNDKLEEINNVVDKALVDKNDPVSDDYVYWQLKNTREIIQHIDNVLSGKPSDTIRAEDYNTMLTEALDVSGTFGDIDRSLLTNTAQLILNLTGPVPNVSAAIENVGNIKDELPDTGSAAVTGGVIGGVLGTIIPGAGTVAGAGIGVAIGSAADALYSYADNNLSWNVKRMIIAGAAGRAGREVYTDDITDFTKYISTFAEFTATPWTVLSKDKEDVPYSLSGVPWMPDAKCVAISKPSTKQDPTGTRVYTAEEINNFTVDDDGEISDTVADSLNSVAEAGYFHIKFYTQQELEEIIAPETLDPERLKEKNKDMAYPYGPNDRVFTIDPYYRYATTREINHLKLTLMKYPWYSIQLFYREVLYWLSFLYKQHIFPSITMDVKREDATNEEKILQDLKNQMGATNDSVDAAVNASSENLTDEEKVSLTEKQQKLKEAAKNTSEFQQKTATAISQFMKTSGDALDRGKLFAAIALAITDGDKGLIDAMERRDYDILNGYVNSAFSPNTNIVNSDTARGRLRKFILALVGMGAIDDVKDIGKAPATPAQKFYSAKNQRKILEAAEDPAQWLFHSFYDMCRTDCRGRLLRAFPTFYMLLVDEGRKVGFWKLHDNFYNTNSIAEIKIVKSRKIPADTASITMSNLFDTFTTQDEDGKYNYKYNFNDVFDSIFSPKKYAEQEEMRRSLTPEINRAKLRPGVRIHIRMGYGNDASLLGTTFNGTIAEIKEGPAMELIAQGDGVELCNQLLDVDRDDLIDDVMYRENFLGNTLFENTGGQTPKTILDTLLTQRGSWLAKQLEDTDFSEYFNENPYGIYHFGDPKFKDIEYDGEPTQNIYEIDKTPSFGKDMIYNPDTNTVEDQSGNSDTASSTIDDVNTDFSGPGTGLISDIQLINAAIEDFFQYDEYLDINGDETAPSISFLIGDKTIWDILHICASTSPEFIGSVADFGFRSTMFLGRPKYYYAFDYKRVNGSIIERRKPFSQYHIYWDDCDIINNTITASKKNLKTVVTGLYTRELYPTTSHCKVGPLYTDIEIFPENQRSILYDTQLVARNKWWNGGYPTKDYLRSADQTGGRSVFTYLGSAWNFAGKVIGGIPNYIGQMVYNNVVPDTMKDDRHARIARNMTASKLKDCMREMYQGQLLVMGDPSVKPYDRFFVTDVFRDISGCCTVRDVTHMFSVKNGFTTAITPDCISVVDDRDEFVVQQMMAKLSYTLLSTTIVYKIASTVSAKLYASGISTVKAGESIIANLFKTGRASSLAGTATEYFRPLSGVLGRMFSGVRGIAAVGTAAATATISVPAIVATILGMTAVYCVTSTLSNMLKNFTENLQVLKVFPLKRHGLPYTSGLEGSTGLVQGSPAENETGSIKTLVSWLAPSTGNTALSWSGSDMLGNILRMMFVPEDIQNIAARYRVDSEMTTGDGSPYYSEERMANLFNSISSKAPVHFKNSISILSKYPACAWTNSREVKRSMEHFQILSDSNLVNDGNLRNHSYLPEEPILKEMLQNSFFRMVHNGQEFSDYNRLHTYHLPVKDEIRAVNGIEDASGNHVVDLPYLSPRAASVLSCMIQNMYDTVRNHVVTNENDTETARKNMENEYVVLKKALRAGDINDTYGISGFSFVLEGFGTYTSKHMEDMLKDIQTKQDPDKTVFRYKKLENGEFAIIVSPEKK